MNKVDWMHPSYRDLIIDESAKNPLLRNQFLKTANLHDLGFALSNTGGAVGKREMPLIVDQDSKQIVAGKFLEFSKESNDWSVWQLLLILDHAIKNGVSDVNWIYPILKDVLLILHNRWLNKKVITRTLDIYCKTTLYFHPLIPLPDFEPSWNEQVHVIENELDEDNFLEGWLINNFVEIIKLIQNYEPRLFIQIEFPEKYSDLALRIVDNLKYDIDSYILSPSQEEIGNEINRINDLRDNLINLIEVIPEWNQFFSKMIHNLEKKKDELAEQLHEELEPNYDDFEDLAISDPIFDIDKLFEDL